MKSHSESIHAGKRFKSEICTSHFKARSRLKSHIESVHEGEPLKCDICPSIFTKTVTWNSMFNQFMMEKDLNVRFVYQFLL